MARRFDFSHHHGTRGTPREGFDSALWPKAWTRAENSLARVRPPLHPSPRTLGFSTINWDWGGGCVSTLNIYEDGGGGGEERRD